jgi:hypothetical protein
VDIDSTCVRNSTANNNNRMGYNGVVGTVTLTYENLVDCGEIQEQKEVIILDSSVIIRFYCE